MCAILPETEKKTKQRKQQKELQLKEWTKKLVIQIMDYYMAAKISDQSQKTLY